MSTELDLVTRFEAGGCAAHLEPEVVARWLDPEPWGPAELAWMTRGSRLEGEASPVKTGVRQAKAGPGAHGVLGEETAALRAGKGG